MPDANRTDDLSIEALRRDIIGSTFRFTTPFGERLMVYGDYTASGRSVRFVERYLMKIQERYANTHTEDDETGRSTTEMLHAAEGTIKRLVNGGPETCIIAAGTGCTGAIQKLQEILGVYVPPASRRWLETGAAAYAAESGTDAAPFTTFMHERRPVVFVGPFEHHSNEISWRESLARVVQIRLGDDGNVDLADLEAKVSDPRYGGVLKIGSFSAASNVTGIRTPVYDVARILHRHGALACFDFAASAPYVEIDMNRDDESYFDAVYLSPHKFLGGPGSSGILLFRRDLYPADLPPTFAAGGTVDYVGPESHDYTADIEAREKPGTPGTLQVMKAALAMELKEAIGLGVIEKREDRFVRRFMERFGNHEKVEILGRPEPGKHIAVLSFNVRHGDKYLHPKLVTRLFNDLFGIQSRAGCSCAGPYGHYLLRIDNETSERYRCQIHAGHQGIKPGWVRIGFHYTMDDIDFDFVCDALRFLADRGHLFLPLYNFNLDTGTWTHVEAKACGVTFGLDEARRQRELRDAPIESDGDREAEYDLYLAEARRAADELEKAGPPEYRTLPGECEELTYFKFVNRD